MNQATISLYTEEKFRLTSCFLENTETFKKLFIKSECQHPIKEMFTLQDVYTEIEYIALIATLKYCPDTVTI